MIIWADFDLGQPFFVLFRRLRIALEEKFWILPTVLPLKFLQIFIECFAPDFAPKAHLTFFEILRPIAAQLKRTPSSVRGSIG